MTRSRSTLALALIMGLTVVPAAAQQGNALRGTSRGTGRPGLADRLGQFGRSLVGGEQETQAGQHSGRNPHRHVPQGAAEQGVPHVARSTAHGAMMNSNAARRSSRRTAQQNYEPDTVSPPSASHDEPANPSTEPTADAPDESLPDDAHDDAPTEPADEARATDKAEDQESTGGTSAAERLQRRLSGRPLADETESGDATPGADGQQAAEHPGRLARAEQSRPLSAGRAGRGENSEDDLLITRHSPMLGVETAGPRKIKVGEPAKYKVMLKNSGQVAAQDVVVSIRLPEWAEVKSTDPTRGAAELPSSDRPAEGLKWHLDQLEAQSQESMVLEIIPRKSRPFDLAVQWTHSPVGSQAMVEVQEAKLVMALSGPEEVYYGEQEVYKLTLSNPGTGDAENVVVRLLPTTPGDTQTASHRIGTIAAGHTKVVELELTARDPGRLTIQAEATADGGLQASIVNEVLIRRGELNVELAGPKQAYTGTTATYRVHLSNTGNAAAKNVQVALMLPAGAKYVSDNAGGRAEAGQSKVIWQLAQMRPESQQEFIVRCRLDHPGDNHPQVVCTADTDLRDSSTMTTNVEALADLTLQVVDPQGPVAVGDDAVYELTVRNRGTKSAENVEVVAFFSEGIEPTEVEGEQHQIGEGQVVFEPVARLDAGQTLVLRIVARASAPGNHIIRAQARCESIQTMLTQEETTLFFEGDTQEFAAGNEADDSTSAEPAPLSATDSSAASADSREAAAEEAQPSSSSEEGTSQESDAADAETGIDETLPEPSGNE